MCTIGFFFPTITVTFLICLAQKKKRIMDTSTSHPSVIAIKRPRVTSAPDTILFDSVPYAKRRAEGDGMFHAAVQPSHAFPMKRPHGRDDDDERRQRLRIDAVDGGVVYASLVGCDEDFDVVEYRPCPHPTEWDAPPVVMDVDWGPLFKERYRRRTTAVFGW